MTPWVMPRPTTPRATAARTVSIALLVVTLASCAPQRSVSPRADLADARSDAALAGEGPVRLLGDRYPLEVTWPFHAALLHWVDSLAGAEGAGLTAGKTVPAHRHDVVRRFGPLDGGDAEALQRFAEARRRYARLHRDDDPNGMTRAFFETRSLDAALRLTARLAGESVARDVAAALHRFEGRYRQVWDDGRIPRRFVARALADPRRGELAEILAAVARFYGSDPASPRPPRLIVVPTPSGYGTHAQALGRTLLLEVRDSDDLIDQVGPIVHENAHMLFLRVPGELQRALVRAVRGRGPSAVHAWAVLIEALPTAIGQGVAERRLLGPAWTERARWYHRDDVDRYAKALYPMVDDALRDGRRFDVPFVLEAIAAYDDEHLTRRSP